MSKISNIPDFLLTLPAFFLISLGILVIYSSDPKLALQQSVFALIGLFIYWLFSLINFDLYRQYTKYFYWVILGLLIVVFILGVETRGSVRWIPLGITQIQPSEFAKPILILFLADFWSKSLVSWRNIVKSVALILPILALVFKQPDLGTALTLGFIWLIMLIGANVSLIKLAIMGISSFAFTPLIWLFLKDYQRERISSFLSPTQDPLGIGYNVIQSMISVGSGEFLGRGLGRGTQSRLQFLPEFRTDFIFASIAEELGFLGSMIVLVLYGALIARCFKLIGDTNNKFGSLIIFGVLGMLFFQIVVNMGMNVGLVPITGITLPLLSYGGSSVISTFISLGFVASVARFGRRKLLIEE
jgi:rod shape determining protein RodA